MVDRGFRDSVSVMRALGLDVAMPPFLDGKQQFSFEEANQSRCITKVRWGGRDGKSPHQTIQILR